MGNTRPWAAAFRVAHVAVAALAVVLVVFLEDAVRGEGTKFAMMVPLSLIFATLVWTVLAGALVALSFIDRRRKNMAFTLIWAASSAFRVVHVAVAALAVVLVVFLGDLFIQGTRYGMDIFAPTFVTLVWTVLAGALVALSFIDRRRKNMIFTLVGAASSTFVFAGAVASAPSLYGWDLRPMGWYALLATSVPLLMFAGILLRDMPFSYRLPDYLRHGLIAGAFLALAAGMALQMKVSASASGFGRELGAFLDTGKTEVHFSEITDFEWDLVEIYGPYTSDRALSEAAREGVDALTVSQLRWNDDFTLVVFIDEDRVVYYEIVPDTVAVIRDSDNRNPVVRRYGEARARVEYPEGGWTSGRLWFE